MDENRGENESWPAYFRRIHDAEPTASVEVDSEPIVNQLLDELASEIEVNVEIDGDNTSLNEDDVRRVIENELERTFGDRLPER